MSNRPLRTQLRRGESLASFVSRSAGLHGAPNAATFATWFGANFRELCRGTDRDLDKMADILGCEPKEMKKRVILGKQSTRRFCDMELPKSFVRQFDNKVCPHCILHDEKSGDGRMVVRPFARLTWAFAHHNVCPKHCKRLVSLPSLPWELGDDFHLRLRAAKNSPDPGWEGEYEEPSAIDRYIVARFEGEDHPATWLDDLPLSAALRLCEAIGHEHDRNYRFKTAKALPSNDRINDGFNRIAESEEKFRSELQDVISRNYPRRTFTAFTVFADLTADFIDDLYRPEFSKAVDVMREVAYQILPLGPGDELFGPVPHRRFHTVKTAAREFEIPVSILDAATRAVKNVNQNRPNLPMLYDKSVFEKVVSSLRRSASSEVSRFKDMMERERIGESSVATRPGESLPLEIAAGELRTTIDVLWSLADEGFLAIFPASKPKPHWRISKSDIAEFRDRYISGIELRHMLRRWKNSGEPRSEQDFAPVICRSIVGENFYSRPNII